MTVPLNKYKRTHEGSQKHFHRITHEKLQGLCILVQKTYFNEFKNGKQNSNESSNDKFLFHIV